eukprot:7930736-Pyramimonas_sp.AAC.2
MTDVPPRCGTICTSHGGRWPRHAAPAHAPRGGGNSTVQGSAMNVYRMVDVMAAILRVMCLKVVPEFSVTDPVKSDVYTQPVVKIRPQHAKLHRIIGSSPTASDPSDIKIEGAGPDGIHSARRSQQTGNHK